MEWRDKGILLATRPFGETSLIIDVFTPEPIEKNSILWNTPNLIITPHVSSDDNGNYVELTLNIFIKNLKLFIENKELNNQVDKNLGY